MNFWKANSSLVYLVYSNNFKGWKKGILKYVVEPVNEICM